MPEPVQLHNTVDDPCALVDNPARSRKARNLVPENARFSVSAPLRTIADDYDARYLLAAPLYPIPLDPVSSCYCAVVAYLPARRPTHIYLCRGSQASYAAFLLLSLLSVEADGLLDSRACIRFLLKLLNPPISHSVEKKAPKIRFNLLEIQKPQTLNSTIKGDDSSSRALLLKVKEILVSCNSIKPGSENDDDMKRPELSSRWIALLTMEKACSSTVSFEDATETRKTGGKFKESLRELKGLDAIFDVVADCHSTLQDYLLSMKAKLDSDGSPLSFVGIVISCIKFLSGLSLLQNTSDGSNDGKLTCLPKNSLVPKMGKNTGGPLGADAKVAGQGDSCPRIIKVHFYDAGTGVPLPRHLGISTKGPTWSEPLGADAKVAGQVDSCPRIIKVHFYDAGTGVHLPRHLGISTKGPTWSGPLGADAKVAGQVDSCPRIIHSPFSDALSSDIA
ncbi:hypothetical protein KSP40_PGU013404 [Platanthera guangdongensis]|uniref:Wings apart-like protein C-terminal domain-containing protein n=1 Tax=Platanthera guangdongensis TaxID=2320717 RepID=A0ABR2MKJ2_9ASPA